jgi:hypothetical protein
VVLAMNARRYIYLLLFFASFASAQTINYSVSTQKTASSSVAATINWSTTPAGASCLAWGSWWGKKAAAGTETKIGTGMRQFNLRCRWPVSGGTGDGFADLTWVAPTENTDGTPYTNPSGYEIKYGTPPSMLHKVVPVPHPNTTHRVQPLPPALWGFCVTAVNAAGVESSCSVTVTKQVVEAISSTTVERAVGITVNAAPSNVPP